jgi:hypothetical protein
MDQTAGVYLPKSSPTGDWKVIDRGVNDQPFLWKKGSGNTFVMVDIFNPDLVKRCYSVFVLHGSPYATKARKKVVGIACADKSKGGWIRAYERARRIAERFMAKA